MKFALLCATACTFAAVAAAAAPKYSDEFRIWVVDGFYTGRYESLALRRIQSNGGPFWLAERRTRTTAGITGPTIQIERQWVDGRKCARLNALVEEAASIQQPSVSGVIPPFHGARVYLGKLRPGGRYEVRSDYEGPVTQWWRKASEELKACGPAPMFDSVDGERLPLTLEADADEEHYRALGGDEWSARQALMSPAP
jgi:hypothetical protein